MKTISFQRNIFLWVVALLLGQTVYGGEEAVAIKEKIKNLEANSAINLGKFTWQKPEGEPSSGQVTDYSGMTYDPHHQRILLFGGGHSATWTDAIYAFSTEDLTWQALYQPTPFKYYSKDNFDKSFWKKGDTEDYPRPVGRHTYDLLIVPDDRKEFLMLRSGTGPSSAAPGFGYEGGAGGKYDFASKKWQMIDAKLIPFGGYGGVSEYDPISKMVIGQAGQNISAYDPEKNTSTIIMKNILDKNKDKIGYSGSLVYYPPNQKMYFFGPNQANVWALNINRENLKESSLEKVENSGDFSKAENSFVYDSKNQIIGGGILNNKFYAFDPKTNQWQAEEIKGGTEKLQMLFHCISYCPSLNAYIFIGKDRNVWAYRWK